MNYRHAFHAGNFADAVKHVVVTRIVEYLKRKEKAFRVIDTHAGAGLYDLSSDEARRTGEWQGGVGRLLAARREGEIANLLSPFLEAVRAANQGEAILHYPGSPMIVRHLMRSQDRLTAIELHPDDVQALKARFAGDFQARVIELDGWLALGAHLPPKEKRGLVLVDPPFEKEGEFARMIAGLKKAHRRWPSGIYALWYPIKDYTAVERFRDELRKAGIPRILDISVEIRPRSAQPRLDGCGMVVVNPPFVLQEELRRLLPFLGDTLAETSGWRSEAVWLAGEAPAS